MQCPECSSTHIRNNGEIRGKQNHICVACGRQFIDVYAAPQGYSDAVKTMCLKMYVNGMGFRGIERVSGVHYTTDTVGEVVKRLVSVGQFSDEAI